MMLEIINGVLQTDPHKIDGVNQVPDNGFMKYWNGWGQINQMVKLAEDYLGPTGNDFSSNKGFPPCLLNFPTLLLMMSYKPIFQIIDNR